MIKEPKLGMKVTIVNPGCCDAEILTGHIREIRGLDSFTVGNDEDFWYCCRNCVVEDEN